MDIKKILFKTNTIDVEKALPDAVVLCGQDGKIQWVNDKAADIFETSKMHLLTSNITDFIENAINLAENAILTDTIVITKGVSKEVYFDMTAKNVEEGLVLSFRPVRDYEKAKSLKEEEDEYKSINREKNAFLLKLANDFKSPLQSIVGFAQAMSDGLGGTMSEQQDKYINIIKKNSAELMYFVSKLLELSQSEVELCLPDYKTFDIVNLVNSVIRFNEQLYKGKDLRWQVVVDEDLKNTIVSDENVLKNILQNVMDVILKSVEIGDITIKLTKPTEEIIEAKELLSSDYLIISISSSSLLLSDSDLECMFDPYKIVDTTNRKNLLRAIILACVKNWVHSLDGMIWVESTMLKSTSFNIIVPSVKK